MIAPPCCKMRRTSCWLAAGYTHCRVPPPKTAMVRPPASSAARCAMASTPIASPLTTVTLPLLGPPPVAQSLPGHTRLPCGCRRWPRAMSVSIQLSWWQRPAQITALADRDLPQNLRNIYSFTLYSRVCTFILWIHNRGFCPRFVSNGNRLMVKLLTKVTGNLVKFIKKY